LAICPATIDQRRRRAGCGRRGYELVTVEAFTAQGHEQLAAAYVAAVGADGGETALANEAPVERAGGVLQGHHRPTSCLRFQARRA
jgi:hypothetical protein